MRLQVESGPFRFSLATLGPLTTLRPVCSGPPYLRASTGPDAAPLRWVLPPPADVLDHRRIAAPVPQGLQLPVRRHAVFQPLGHPSVDVLGVCIPLSLLKGWMPVVPAAWAAWPQGNSGTREPSFGRRPTHQRSPGWNVPPLSSRSSLSLVPPSAKCEHLHEDFVNDVPDSGWVNTISAISISFSSAVAGFTGTGRAWSGTPPY